MYLVLPWGFWFCCEVFQCFCRDVFGFAVTFLVLLWQLWATIQNRPFTASHSRGTKQPRWRAKVALWQGICTTWMSSCKGPIECVRACTVGKQVMSQKICADAQNCALRYSADEGVVRPSGSILWYYLFVHNCSASYLTKCSEPKEFYLLLHFCVFLVLFRLLAHVRATRTWATHFSHLVTVWESTLRTRVAPMMFVFLLEKE